MMEQPIEKTETEEKQEMNWNVKIKDNQEKITFVTEKATENSIDESRERRGSRIRNGTYSISQGLSNNVIPELSEEYRGSNR